MWRAGAAGVSAVAAAAAGLVTAFVTAHPSLGLWVALAVLVVIGAVLQAAVAAGERRAGRDGSAGPAGTAGARNVTNRISGGVQHGPVTQGGDFTGLTFGAPPPQAAGSGQEDGTP